MLNTPLGYNYVVDAKLIWLEIALLQYIISNLQQSGLFLLRSGPASWSDALGDDLV